MRERRPGDWRVDLARRHPLESFVEQAIDDHLTLTRLSSSTQSLDRLDYQLLAPGERLVELELKAKHQPYQGWSHLRPDVAESDLFILDELATRKLLAAGRYATLLVRDIPTDRWVLWSTMDLFLADKTRYCRRLATGTDRVKAKLLYNLADSSHHYDTIGDALDGLTALTSRIDRYWNAIEPWPTRQAAS